MIRKHTRRAVKAAFAVAIAIPIVLGGTANASPSAAPTIVLGSKNFTEEFILGQLYKQALEAKGFKVSYKEGVGSSEIIDAALTSGKINMYPEYTGVIVLDLAHQKGPATAQATYLAAKAFEEKRGFTLLNRTPFYDSDAFGTLTSTAKKYGLKTISDVKKIPGTVTYGGFPECKTRITCFAGQLGSSKYTVLTDTKHIFGFQNVAPIVSKTLVTKLGPKFVSTVNAVSAKLTLPAIRAMNKAVGIDKKSAASVAGAFLKANGLA